MIPHRILLTGFEPFNGEVINPSMVLAESLPEHDIEGLEIHSLLLPVVRETAHQVLFRAIENTAPSILLMFGEAGGRAQITPERIAINVDDYEIADNAGQQPRGETIVDTGADGYFSTLPIIGIVESLNAAAIPAHISNSAGTYLCNRIFYHAMHYLAQNNSDVIAGFIHLPYLPQQAVDKAHDTPSMPASVMQTALQRIIQVCAAAQDASTNRA